MNLDKIPVAVIGATGAVGQRFVALLTKHPWFDLKIVAASGKSQGHVYRDIVSWRLEQKMPEEIGEKKVEQINPKTFKDQDIKLLFSALPSQIAKDVEMKLTEDGFCVFSNASAFRMANDVPLLIADVNPDHLALVEHQKRTKSGYVVTNANCSVIGLATALKPLHEAFGIKSVVVTTYQALSGAGYPGVPSLDITGNIVPYIQFEEEKIEVECRKILGKLSDSGIEPSPFNVFANCARVPVRDGHLESVLVDLEEDVSEEEVKRALSGFEGLDNKIPTSPIKPIIVTEDESRPQPIFDVYNGEPDRARGMAVTIGRIKKIHGKIRFFLLVHNTVRGAAGCSIMNAELAKLKDYL